MTSEINEDVKSQSYIKTDFNSKGDSTFFGLSRTTLLGGKQGRVLRWTITFTATLAFSLFGYNQGMLSGILQGERFVEEFPPLRIPEDADAGSPEAKHVSVLQGGVTSSYEIGCLFGAMYMFFYGEKVGRKPAIVIGSFIVMIGAVISTTAMKDHWGLGQFVVGRVVTGVGNGMNTATVPVWQSELTSKKLRGKLVNLEGAVVAVGTMVAYWLDFGFNYIDSSVQWRFPVAMQILFAGVVFGFMLFLPESPRWMVGHGHYSEGEYIQSAVMGLPADSPVVIEEMAMIQEEVERMGQHISLRKLLTNGRHAYLNRMLIGASTQLFQQFTGCNAAIYYSTVLFSLMNVGRTLSLIMGGVFSTVYALSTIPSFYLIDKLGRRRLFLVGAVGQGCSFIITMAFLIKARTDEHSNLFKGAAFGLYLFIFFFAFTILPLPWIYPAEINSLKTRTRACSFSTMTNWLTNFAVVMFTPVFVNRGGEGDRWTAYMFFALMNFLWIPVIYFFYPETAGRSLEEIDLIFAKAYQEKILPHSAAKQLPHVQTSGELVELATQYGIHLGVDSDDSDSEKASNLHRDDSPLPSK